MKSSSAAAILAFAASVTSSPLFRRQGTCIVNTVSNPSSTDIVNAINQWAIDVSAVNDYLNTVGSITDPNDLLIKTQAVLMNAQDEPCQFKTLKNNPDASGPGVQPKFACAVGDLDSVFQLHVLDNLNAIIADPSNTDTVANAVADINIKRCCNVLPDVDTLFLNSAVDFGVADQVPLSVPREDACADIDCVPACDGLADGSAGK